MNHLQFNLCRCLLLILLMSLSLFAQQKAPANNLRNEEAKFSGHGVTLAGTLTLPKVTVPKKTPAVLLLGAFGATPRDGLAVTPTVIQPIYKLLAEHLAAQGFVTFRYDKRCAGASGCQKETTFEEIVDDAKAALELLRARPEVDPAKIFVFGHSEGGQIASIIAASEAKLAGLIMAAAPGRTLNKILREQTVTRMREAKAPAEKIAAFTAKFDAFTRVMMSGDMSQMTLSFDPQDPNDVMMQTLVKQPGYTTPMFINDPLQNAQAVTAPVLLLQGDKDLSITVKDAQFLNESFMRLHHPDTTLKLLTDVNHLLKTNKAPAVTALSQDVTQPLDASVLAAINEWLAKRK